MGSSPVMIKGTKSGIILVLDKIMDFEKLKTEIAEKFKSSSKFLGNATLALTFDGRTLSDKEQMEIIDIIHSNSNLNIACVVETDAQKEELLKKSLNEHLMELTTNSGQFYKGNLRSGQVLESETSIIVLGDVNPGSKIVSKGNIIILGTLKGTAYAGASGNEGAFVMALDMLPMQIRISDIIARSSDEKPKKHEPKEPKIAYVEDGNIYIEPFSKDVVNDIRYFK